MSSYIPVGIPFREDTRGGPTHTQACNLLDIGDLADIDADAAYGVGVSWVCVEGPRWMGGPCGLVL